jgi:predicted nucleotidyltransferase
MTFRLLEDAAKAGLLLSPDDFSDALYARLWAERDAGYADFADCGGELSRKLARNLDSFTGFTQFAQLLKSRDLTYTRICRALLHILLGIRQSDYESPADGILYLRVLGFRKEAAPLLSAIKKETSAPLVTKVADAPQFLSDEAVSVLKQDIRCADLYRGIAAMHSKKPLPNEYEQQLVML